MKEYPNSGVFFMGYANINNPYMPLQFRGPDYISANASWTVPHTKGILGLSLSANYDRYGVFRWTGSVGAGRPGESNFGRNIAAGWLLQSRTPTKGDLNNFLMGNAISVAGGGGPYFLGGEVVRSPGTNTAIGLGFYTPQLGASYGYTFDTKATKIQTPLSW